MNSNYAGWCLRVVHKHGPITFLHFVDEDNEPWALEFNHFDSVAHFDEYIKENKIYCHTIVDSDDPESGIEVHGVPVRFTKIPGPIATYYIEPEGCSTYMIAELTTYYIESKED